MRCPECKSTFRYEDRLVFEQHPYPDISPSAFMHPLDRSAINTVRKVPGVDFAIRKMMEFGYEKIIRVNSMADDVKVTPKTCGFIHDMAEQAAKSLGVQMPEVYVNQDPFPNAWTIGTEFPMISIHSGLIDLMNEDELYTVVAHEMGHIKCYHVLYHMLASFLSNAAGALGVAGYAIIPLNLALLEWSRKSELSADRAALLVTNDKNAITRVLMKLAGGSARVSRLINEDEFISQASQFEELTKGISLNNTYRVLSNISRTHPFPVLRAHEIDQWAKSEGYQAITNGDFERKAPALENKREENLICPQCKSVILADASYCEKCGSSTKRMDNPHGGSGVDEVKEMTKAAWEWLKEKGGLGGPSGDLPDKGERICPRCGYVALETHVLYCPHDGTAIPTT
ncbi:MAG: M48 family metalloprotease, partial [Desulfomonile tiedjei]|nr:M48 family metalloprotease [Desulfomonile tiedjei]